MSSTPDDPFGSFSDLDDDFLAEGAAMAADSAASAAFEGGDVGSSSGGFNGMSDEESAAAFAAREAERAKNREDLYGRLNTEQHEAVFMAHESALVLAAAGSGKTSVLTARVARLVTEGEPSLPASSVMAVTFTNKASQEMKSRLRSLLNKSAVNELWVGTFHSLCNRILRDNHEAAGLPKSFAILDTDGQESVVRNILKDFGLTKASVKEAKKLAALVKPDLLDMPVAGAVGADPLAGVGEVDEGEDDESAMLFLTPKQCVTFINSRKERGRAPEPSGQQITTRSSDGEQLEAIYHEYQIRLAQQGLLDFQDLLARAVDLLRSQPAIRDAYRDKFRAILVDEFQDTNDIQFEWLSLIKGPKAHVTAVGDDDQSIYAFRGADPRNMGRFLKEMAATPAHPNGRLIRLEQNYRSLPHILDAANAIIERNTNRLGKVLRTSKPDTGDRIDLVTYGNGFFEASSIASGIYQRIKDDGVPPSEIAVLYRTNTQSRLLEQELNKLGVPLTVYGGFRFYERQEIKNVLAYLDLVADISRDLSFMRVANFPPRGIGERTLEDLRQQAQSSRISMIEMVDKRVQQMMGNPASIGNAAAQKKLRQLQSFTDTILDLADAAETMPLSRLIEEVVARTGMATHYAEEATGSKSSEDEAKERMENISELVSAARQFELENPLLKTATEQLPEYLTFVALMTSTSESDMSKKNTVSLMTVHSSKGLEFDHVYIAGIEEGVFPHSRAIAEDEERGNGRSIEEASRMVYVGGVPQDEYQENDGPGLQEERRLMYVALTRARKTLTLSHALERMNNGESKEAEPSRFIRELPRKRLNLIDDRETDSADSSSRNAKKRGYNRPDSDLDSDTSGRRSRASPWASGSKGSALLQPAKAQPKTETPDSHASAKRIAVIGTAGRDKSQPMDASLWEAMLADLRGRVGKDDVLVSGGAAWADHLAVHLFLDGHVGGLELFLPAPMVDGEFDPSIPESAASAANYYHGKFKAATGVDGLAEISVAIDMGATVSFEPAAPGYRAMFARNAKVARRSTGAIAYTFGEGDEPADGGTQDTWNQIKGPKTHVALGALRKTSPRPTDLKMAPPTGGSADKPVKSVSAAATSSPKPWQRKWSGKVGTGSQVALDTAKPAASARTGFHAPGATADGVPAGPAPATFTRLRMLGSVGRAPHATAAQQPEGTAEGDKGGAEPEPVAELPAAAQRLLRRRMA